MTFDYTHGKNAKYVVTINDWRGTDKCYFCCFKDAKNYFDNLCDNKSYDKYSLNLWEYNKDIRKAHRGAK